MKIYVARHGKTLLNEQNRVCGRTDIDLTDKGIAQAKELALTVKEYQIDLIISSPLKRALQTSKVVSDYCTIPMSIENMVVSIESM